MRNNLSTAILILKKRGFLGLVSAALNYAKRNPYVGIFLYTISPFRFFTFISRSKQFVVGSKDIYYAHHIRRTEPSLRELNQQVKLSKLRQTASEICFISYLASTVSLEDFHQTARSILCQTYQHWTWLVVSDSQRVSDISSDDSRIRVIAVDKSVNAPEALNLAITRVHSPFIALIEVGDMLSCHALYAVAEVIIQHEQIDLLYTDTDILADGTRSQPFYKPDWSPALALSIDITSSFMVVNRAVLEQVNSFDARFPTAYQWDAVLKISRISEAIHHIPAVLHHQTVSRSTSEINKTEQETILREHLEQLGLSDIKVTFSRNNDHPLVRWTVMKNLQISIIIPSHDNAALLGKCLESIFSLTEYSNFEVIVVDTGSTQPETFDLYANYEQKHNFLVVEYKSAFNFSAACNLGFNASSGELLLFLNNDTEVLQADWLHLLAQWFELETTGIVGPKLLYPHNTLQHAGIIVGTGGIADHIFSGWPENTGSIFGMDSWYRNYSAVTGACLMISRKVFEEVGGFDEGFILNFSDVDLCLKVVSKGYQVIYTPHVQLIHYESVTHGRVIPRSDFLRASNRFKPFLEAGDPYYNCNLAYAKELRFAYKKNNTPIDVNQRLLEYLPNKELVGPDDRW